MRLTIKHEGKGPGTHRGRYPFALYKNGHLIGHYKARWEAEYAADRFRTPPRPATGRDGVRKGRAIKSQWGSVYAYVRVHHVSSRGGRTPWVATLTRDGAKTWDSGGRIDVMREIQDYASKHQASVLVMYKGREVSRLYPREWGH